MLSADMADCGRCRVVVPLHRAWVEYGVPVWRPSWVRETGWAGGPPARPGEGPGSTGAAASRRLGRIRRPAVRSSSAIRS